MRIIPDNESLFRCKLNKISIPVLSCMIWLLLNVNIIAQAPFSMEDILSFPFPESLTASSTGSRIAWVFNEKGLRNIYVAEGDKFTPRRLTNYEADDGQLISSLSISDDGNWVVYIRGGDFGSNWDGELPLNPSSESIPGKTQIWSVPFRGGNSVLLGEGTDPVISPTNSYVAFVKGGQIYKVPIGGGTVEQIIAVRGKSEAPIWSPDGSRLAFKSMREDHSYIGIFTEKDPKIKWMDPSFNQDGSAVWSPDGKFIAFVRQPGIGGEPDSILSNTIRPWEIMIADASDGKAVRIWKSPDTFYGSFTSTEEMYLSWATDNRIVFLSSQDGWPHLYSLSKDGGTPVLLTPGNFMVEHTFLSRNGKSLVFSGNTGPDKLDIDRRHIIRVSLDNPAMEVITVGDELEWTPVLTGDGRKLAYICATHQRCPLPAVMDLKTRQVKLIAEDKVPDKYPESRIVKPEQIIFKAPDGTDIHCTLFRGKETNKKQPAIVFIHGGPKRQMLLGWHYFDYYSNFYAVNQYLINNGFIVLSVNYRCGIGYGYDFEYPRNGGFSGASEYQDIKAAGEWLRRQDFVIPGKIGIYGGSYGGYLTALGLGRNSDLFSAGVDIHGVHDWYRDWLVDQSQSAGKYEKAPDSEIAPRVMWESSPVSSVKTWKSPVLIIHGDDDRNVPVNQSTDLIKRLIKRGVETRTMIITDDSHHFCLFKHKLEVDTAIADFFFEHLK